MKPVAAEAPALDPGLAILELLDMSAQGLNLTEISKAIGSPKNSTSRFVQTLIGRGYLTRDDDTQRFRLLRPHQSESLFLGGRSDYDSQ